MMNDDPTDDFSNFGDWVISVEEIIKNTIRNCWPREWNEDHISYSLLRGIRQNYRPISFQSLKNKIHTEWDAFKAQGNLEKDCGDIAFLIKLTLPNGNELEGVAFLEAKRSYAPSGRYEAIDWQQLIRHKANTESHRLLLYDHEEIACGMEYFPPLQVPCYYGIHDFESEWFSIQMSRHFRRRDLQFLTQAASLLTPFAIAYRIKDRNLHNFTIPLSYQICCRYLMGHDLDFDPALVSEVKNGVADCVNYLVVAHMAIGPNVEGASIESISFDREYFQPLNPDPDGRPG